MLHRTNIENYWVSDDLPDNAVVAEDGGLVIAQNNNTRKFKAGKFEQQKARLQGELTGLYGDYEVGEPIQFGSKGAAQLRVDGIVGVYSKARTGEGFTPEQFQVLIERALAETPPEDVAKRACELMRQG